MAQFLKLSVKHRTRPDDLPGVVGPARMDRRTKKLTKRLSPGDIAIIDHVDLDRVSADALVRAPGRRGGERGRQPQRPLSQPRAADC